MKLNNNKLTLAIGLALSLSACSPNKTADEYLESAKIHISSNQNAEALIELKNAVRTDLKNSEARLLLGNLYLQRGEAASAEKELQRALELGASVEKVFPKLLKALNLQGRNDDLIELVLSNQDIPVGILPETMLYQALAYLQTGNKEQAVKAIAEANEVSEESVYSQLGNAYLKANASNIDESLNKIDQILIKSPELTEALLLQGQLLVLKEDYKAALTAFNAYFDLLPNDMKVRLYLANTYIKNKQFEEANQHIDFLLKVVPEHALTNQLKGLVYYEEEDYKQALSHTDKAIQNGMNTTSNRVIAGLSAFKLEEYERAHQFLVATTDVLPSDHPVRRVLAIVQIRLGYTDDASEVLSQYESNSPEDANLFATASYELFKSGNINEAKSLLSKADGLASENSESLTKIGILKLSMNDLAGITDLEKATEIDPDSALAKTSLAAAYIQNKEYEKAITLGEDWKSKEPNRVEPYNLVAKVHLLQNNVKAAESELKQALDVSETNSLSILYFANKSLKESKPEKAIIQLDKLLSVQPDNIKALTMHYRATKIAKSDSVAIDKIENSYKRNPNILAYRLLFARVLFLEQDFNQVIELLRNTDTEKKLQASYWVLLSDSYFKTNQIDNSLKALTNWVKSNPSNREARLRKTSTLEKLNKYEDALIEVDSFLTLTPKDDQFSILRAYYLIRNKQFDQAQTQINTLSSVLKELPITQGLQGQIWLTEGAYDKALPGLQGLYDQVPSPYNAALIFATLKELKQDNDGLDFLVSHVQTRPDDYISRTLLAEKAVALNKEVAKEHYLILLEKFPNNLTFLNNLAWVEYELANYQKADELATRALEVDSEQPQVLDTAGLIKFKLGNKDAAIELLEKAKKLAPEDKVIEQHYQSVIK